MVIEGLAKREGGEIIKAGAKVPIRLTEVGIETIQHNMMMAEKLVMTVLERDIDYGRLPGTPSDGLWDPGASKIINAWNSYPDYTVLHHIEEDGLISFTIVSHIISRDSQEVLGSGIGACSTRETKYKYRWEPDPENYGYTPEQIKKLKTKSGKEQILYRIANPEFGELVNTVAKMSAKRADVDAAQSLPGVGSALRKLFQGGKSQPDWTTFWSQARAMDLKESDAHEMLEVTSMKDWVSQGKTLKQAIMTLASKLKERAQRADKVASEPPAEESSRETPNPKREPQSIKTLAELMKACLDDFKMQPKEVIKELGYSSQADITESPAECYARIVTTKAPRIEKGA